MAKKIPPIIKSEVLRDWLNGLSRDNIAIKNKISRGSVSNIINAVKAQDIPDIDLLRAVAVELKSNDLTLITLATSIRLRNMVDKLHLPEEKVDKLLEFLPIFFYINDDRDSEKILEQLELVYDITHALDIPLFDMPLKIDILKEEIEGLKAEKSELEKLVEQERSDLQKIRETLYAACWLIRNPMSTIE
jgi:transcriptional regulator with XRE-family HTH domain